MSVFWNVKIGPWLEKLFSYKSAEDLRRDTASLFINPGSSLPSRVFVVGASHIGMELIDALSNNGISVEGFFDDDANKREALPSIQPVNMLRDRDKTIPVVLATQRVLKLQKRVEDMGFEHVWPFFVLPILAPDKFEPHPFYSGMLEDLFHHRDNLRELSMMLEDEKSRTVLDAIIGFRLTLDAKMLEDVIISDSYLSKEIFSFTDSEVFVDGGAFDGDTIRSFINICSKDFRKIISFEPSDEPFAVLKRTFEADHRIKLFQACLCDKETTLSFENSGRRDSSTARTDNGQQVKAMKIDNLPEANEITFIKMNIEGAEQDALNGAEKVIRNNHPKLAVAVYHRPSDLWVLPRLIKKFNSNYKLYLRQHDGGIIESVIYAVPMNGCEK